MYKIIFLSFVLIFLLSCSGKKAETNVTFGICADVHLPTMHDSEYRITTFIDRMKISRPDFIIELGDFGIPHEKYHHLFAIWDAYPGKKYHVIGNHEMDGGTQMAEALAYRGQR